jgi:hypothetical protein
MEVRGRGDSNAEGNFQPADGGVDGAPLISLKDARRTAIVMRELWRPIQKLDAWLLSRRFGWRAGWLLFAVMGILATVSTFTGYFPATFVVGAAYLFFGVRYVRPNL